MKGTKAWKELIKGLDASTVPRRTFHCEQMCFRFRVDTGMQGSFGPSTIEGIPGWGSSADEATLLVLQPTCCFDPYCVPRRLGSRGGLAARQPEPCPRDLPNRGSGHDEGRPGGRAGHRRGPQEERVQQGAGCEMKDNARKSEGAAGNLKECQLP